MSISRLQRLSLESDCAWRKHL